MSEACGLWLGPEWRALASEGNCMGSDQHAPLLESFAGCQGPAGFSRLTFRVMITDSITER